MNLKGLTTFQVMDIIGICVEEDWCKNGKAKTIKLFDINFRDSYVDWKNAARILNYWQNVLTVRHLFVESKPLCLLP